MSEREQQALSRFLSAKVQRLEPGVPLVEAGETPSNIHVILSSWTCHSKQAASHRRQATAFYLPGDVCDFGEFMVPYMDSSIVSH